MTTWQLILVLGPAAKRAKESSGSEISLQKIQSVVNYLLE
jgi:hypothetical protein